MPVDKAPSDDADNYAGAMADIDEICRVARENPSDLLGFLHANYPSKVPAPNTAPLDGGIRQLPEPSDSGVYNSTSRESLPNNCDGGVPVPDYPASLSHNSVGDAEKRTDDAQIASMNLHAAPVDAQDGGVPEMVERLKNSFLKQKNWIGIDDDGKICVNYDMLTKAALAAMQWPDEETAVRIMFQAAQSEARGSTATETDMQDAYRALTKHKAGK